MATEKNITMKQFNGTDYDTLYPKTIASQIPDVYSKTDTITAETLAQLGLTADKLPNNAFQQIKTLIDNVQVSADSKARIQTSSYVGTGTYGAGNSCSLTFDEIPKIIFIITLTGGRYLAMPFSPLVTEFNTILVSGSGSRSVVNTVSVSGNTISWYLNYAPDSHAYAQMNYSGNTYYYFAFS